MSIEKPTIEEPKLEKEISQEQEKSSIERLEEIPFRIDKKIEILLCLKEGKLATDISIET